MIHRLTILCGVSVFAFGSWLSAGATKVMPGAQALSNALEEANPGDVLELPDGTNTGTFVISKAITLKAGPKTVFNPSVEVRPAWEKDQSLGDGVFLWRLSQKPVSVQVDEKILAEVRWDRTQAEGPWNWLTLLQKGPPLSGGGAIKGMWIWDPNRSAVLVRLFEGKPPSGRIWHLLTTIEPCLSILNCEGAKILGGTFSGAHTAIRVGKGAVSAEVAGVCIKSYEDRGIQLTGGASRSLIRSNEISRGSLESWASPPGDGPDRQANYEIWKIHKNVGSYDRVGIEIYHGGSNNLIVSNYLRETFDGINLGDWEVETHRKPMNADEGRGTKISGNLIVDTRDSGIEVGISGIDVEVDHNHLLRTHGGIRFKWPQVGPVYVHHNFLEDDRGFNFWFSMNSSAAEGYIYQNTVTGTHAALIYSSMEKGATNLGTPGWHVLNNLFVTTNGYFENRTKNFIEPNFHSAGNVFVGGSAPYSNNDPHESGSFDIPNISLEGRARLVGRGPAWGAGVDLRNGIAGRILPGIREDPIRTNGRPDAGAFPTR